MTKPNKSRPYRRKRDTHVWVFGDRKDPPDTHRLSKALLALMLEQAGSENDARASHLKEPDDEPH